MNLPSELWTMALTTEFARADNDYEVLKFKDFYIKFQNFQDPTVFSRTFHVLQNWLIFEGLSRIFQTMWPSCIKKYLIIVFIKTKVTQTEQILSAERQLVNC